jgi:hypothetical protein
MLPAVVLKSKPGSSLQSSFMVFDWDIMETFFKFFIRIYLLHGGGFIVTIPIRLILCIIYIAPSSLPLSSLPAPLTAITRGFLVLFWT